MTDDPLYGDRPKPPLVPMNNEEVVAFDLVRTATTGSPLRRRWPLVVVIVLLLGLVALLVLRGEGSRVRGVNTPQQVLSYLCSHYGAAERTFTSGQATAAEFKRKLDDLPTVTFASASLTRFEMDVQAVGDQVSTYGDIGGATASDLHQLCRQ